MWSLTDISRLNDRAAAQAPALKREVALSLGTTPAVCGKGCCAIIAAVARIISRSYSNDTSRKRGISARRFAKSTGSTHIRCVARGLPSPPPFSARGPLNEIVLQRVSFRLICSTGRRFRENVMAAPRAETAIDRMRLAAPSISSLLNRAGFQVHETDV